MKADGVYSNCTRDTSSAEGMAASGNSCFARETFRLSTHEAVTRASPAAAADRVSAGTAVYITTFK